MANPPLKKNKWKYLKMTLAVIMCMLLFALLGILLMAGVPVIMSRLFY